MNYLLDVNALVSLADAGHIHHAKAVTWYAQLPETDQIYTCATTELGLIRTLLNTGSHPNITSALAAMSALKTSSRLRFTFIPDDLGAEVMPAYVKTARQTTDGHLLMLAAKHSACLATLDTAIPGALLIS